MSRDPWPRPAEESLHLMADVLERIADSLSDLAFRAEDWNVLGRDTRERDGGTVEDQERPLIGVDR